MFQLRHKESKSLVTNVGGSRAIIFVSRGDAQKFIEALCGLYEIDTAWFRIEPVLLSVEAK